MNISKLLKQTAVYWGTPTPDGYGGYTFDTPVEIDCRWEERRDIYLTDVGEEVSNAIVYTESVIDLNSYLFLGTLDDLDSTQLPQNQSGAFLVKATARIPNIKGSKFLRKIWL